MIIQNGCTIVHSSDVWAFIYIFADTWIANFDVLGI